MPTSWTTAADFQQLDDFYAKNRPLAPKFIAWLIEKKGFSKVQIKDSVGVSS